MGKYTKYIHILVPFAFVASCATTPPTDNPWETPDRGYSVSSEEEAVQLEAYLQPCIEYAQDTLSEAYRGYIEDAIPASTFAVAALNDERRTFYAEVSNVHDSRIEGRVSNISSNARVNGRSYRIGNHIELAVTDIVDWVIIYPDRPEKGNLLGKYMLLRQDDLVSGPCNPQHPEFLNFRLFRENYSFVPPVGEEWQMRGRSADAEVSLGNIHGKGPHEVNVVYASRYRVPASTTDQEFINKITELESKNVGDPDRATLVKHEVTVYKKKEAMCVLSHQVIEDKQALLSKSGERGPMIREILSLSCEHPVEKTTVVVITYSHRYQSGHRNPEFPDKATTIFDSLAFTVRNYSKY